MMAEITDTCTDVEAKLATFLEIVNKDEKKKNNFHTDNHILCLASLNLDAIPPSVLDMTMITALILDHNNLSQLPTNLFEQIQLLQKLSLIGNELESIPHNINLLTRLTELHLTANKISHIPARIGELDQLSTLKLGDNALKKLPCTIGGLSNLKEVDLSENELKKLPDSFCWLRNLEILDCSENKLKLLPINFGCLEKLRVLNLELNEISRLPNSSAMFECLEVVDLSHNKLTRLMPTLNCANLVRKVFVNCNLLNELPPWFNSVHSLEELSLRDNRLQNNPFPKDFGNVAKKLIKFDLAGNFMSGLCESFGELMSLESIHLGSLLDELERNPMLLNGNWITYLPDNFGKLRNLRELRLDENKLKRLPENFGGLVNLETLDLGQNDLTELPDSFGELRSLKMCQLSKNALKSLPQSIGNMSSLVDLRLDNNELTELPVSIYKLTQLQTLDLFNNKLTTVPNGLHNLSNLTRLDLEENDFGLSVSEIPRIVFELKYKEMDPALRQWRGRKNEFQLASNDTIPESDVNDTVKSLQNALIQGSSIWMKEGSENEKRKKFVKVEKQQILPQNDETDDYDTSEVDDDDDPNNQCEDNWDGELMEPNTDDDNWDKGITDYEFANCPYDDMQIQPQLQQQCLNIDLMNMHEHINQEMFCPSDIHAKPVFRPRVDFYREEGQFDDAE